MDAPEIVRIVLLGKTGSGKSSAGNVILGEEKFQVSADPNSVTKNCQTEEGNINGMKISVTDTPGIFDPERSDKDLRYSIISCLTECAPGPHAFILVLRVGRYTKEEKEAVRKILEWFEEEALKHTVVLFTHGDELDENQTIKKYVNNNKDLANLSQKCGERVHVIDSKQWHKNDYKNAQYADLLEQLKKMMREKREAGESQAVHTLEELKSRMLEPRTPDQEPSQGSERSLSSGGNLDESECRSNSFQIKRLLTTIDNMVKSNGGRYYTNESLQVIAEAIEKDVSKIKEEMEERGEKAEESEIRRRARERVRTWRLVAGVTGGAVERNKEPEELVDKYGGRVHVIDSKYWNKKDEEPGQGSGRPTSSGGNFDESVHRSNSFRNKQLLTTVDKMVTSNGGGDYTNKSLQIRSASKANEIKPEKKKVIWNGVKKNKDSGYTGESLPLIEEGITDEVNKIKKGGSMEVQEIGGNTKKRIKSKVAGAAVGSLLGLLLGVPVGAAIPFVAVAGLLTAGVKSIRGSRSTDREVNARNIAAVGAAEGTAAIAGTAAGVGAALGTSAAEAAVAGAVVGAGAAAGIGLGVAAGVYVIAGAVRGGMAGAKAGEKCLNTNQAAKESAKAVGQAGLRTWKEVWDAMQTLARARGTAYKKLQ